MLLIAKRSLYFGFLIPLLIALPPVALFDGFVTSAFFKRLSVAIPVLENFGIGSSNHVYSQIVAFVQAIFFVIYLSLLVYSKPFWSKKIQDFYIPRVFRDPKGNINTGCILAVCCLMVMVASDVFRIKFFSIYRWEFWGKVPFGPISAGIFENQFLIGPFSWGMCIIEVAAYYICFLVFAYFFRLFEKLIRV